jgi:Domain of unknown function DUF29
MGRDVLEAGAETPSKASDLYSWARRQAELLRAGRLAEIDPVAIAEEIDDVGEEEYHRLESALRVVMLHLLKWDHQPDRRSRSWALSIREHRRRVLKQLKRSPGLKSELVEALSAAYEDARDEASSETGLPLSAFPAVRRYEFADILERPVAWPGEEGWGGSADG